MVDNLTKNGISFDSTGIGQKSNKSTLALRQLPQFEVDHELPASQKSDNL